MVVPPTTGVVVALHRGHNNFWGWIHQDGRSTLWTAGQFQTGSKRGRHYAAVEVARAMGAHLVGVPRVALQLRGFTHPRRREELLRELLGSDPRGVTLTVRADRPHNGLRPRKARRG